MRPICADTDEIRLTFVIGPDDPIKPPDGHGWWLHAVGAESGFEGEVASSDGGLWLVWARAKPADPEQHG